MVSESSSRHVSTAPEDPRVGVIDGLYGDIRELQAEVGHLRTALTSRSTIDQAKGMLMQRYGIDADAAFSLLARWSSQSNTKVRVLAERLVDLGAQGSAVAATESLRVGSVRFEDLVQDELSWPDSAHGATS